MSSQNIRKMVTTALIIALTIVFQLLRPVLGGSNIISTYIIGSLVNLCLIVAAVAVGLWSGVAVAGDSPAAEAAALFSPRSASLFIALVRQAGLEARLADVVAACLSEAVADAVRGVQWKSVVIAGERNSESLLAALANEITTSRG